MGLDIYRDIERIAHAVRHLPLNEMKALLSCNDVAPLRKNPPNETSSYVRAALLAQNAHDWIPITKVTAELRWRGILIGAPKPRNWGKTSLFRLFISHLSKDKDKASQIKAALLPFGIIGLVAHEDIHPTAEWEREIELALNSMDALLAILTPGLSQSVWAQQEIGIATGRGVKILSVRMGEDPVGFTAKHQAIVGNRPIEELARQIDSILSEDRQTSFRSAIGKWVLKDADDRRHRELFPDYD